MRLPVGWCAELAMHGMHIGRRVHLALLRQRHVRLRFRLFALDVGLRVLRCELPRLLLGLLLLLLVLLHALKDLVLVAQAADAAMSTSPGISPG